MYWYLQALKKYAVFSGRARRMEYWFFFLFNFLISILLGLVDAVTGTLNAETGVGLFSAIYGLAVLIPGIAVTVRRLHDTGRSGWWFLLIFLPIIGGLVLLVFMLFEGEPVENAYGTSPKADQRLGF